MARSSVPPPLKPALARTSPERFDRMWEYTTDFRRWWRSIAGTYSELAQIWGVTESVARRKLRGESPILAIEIDMLPAQYRTRFAEYRAEQASVRTGTDHG